MFGSRKDKDDGGVRIAFDVAPWLLAATLMGCGSPTAPGAGGPGTEVVAKVNGDKITVRQLKDQLSSMRLRPDVDAKALEKQVMRSLVDEQLLVQRAIADKLDDDPSARQAIERARRQILAQAAIEHAGGNMEISVQEARKFYADNPDLFEKRKIFTFRHFALGVPSIDETIKGRLNNARTPAEVVACLRGAGIKFRDHTEVRAAETLPQEILKRAVRMNSGDILLLGNAGGVVLMQLVNEDAEPIDLGQALPGIRTYLASGRRMDTAESLLRDLRRNANIEYADGFADPMGVAAEKIAVQPPAATVASGGKSSMLKRASDLRK